MSDPATDITNLYNELSRLQTTVSSLAHMSNVNTIQVALQARIYEILTSVQSMETTVKNLQKSINDILLEL